MTAVDVAERDPGAAREPPPPASSRLRAALPLLPAVPILALWIYWAPNSGGYFPGKWYPAALLSLAVAVVAGIAAGRALPAARGPRVALLLLTAFVAWAFASLLWADSTGSAWQASNKLLLFLAGAWALALLPWTGRSARLLLAVWSLGIAVVALFSLIGASGTDELSNYLFELRYQHPVGYPNGNAALGVMAMLVALGLSSGRGTHPLAGGVLLAAAALLADFALLSQSRASVGGLAAGLVAMLVLAPDRLRLGLRMLVLGGAVALAAGPVLDVLDTGDAGALGPALDDAVAAIWPSAIAAGVAGAVIGALERLARPHERVNVAARRVGIAAAVLLAGATVVIALASLDRITDTVDEQWTTLTGGEYTSVEGARISNLDPYERPDYFRVAIDLFEESPVVGVGAGSFEREYTARKREPKHSRYAHNMFLRALGEGGAVAAALLVAFFLSLFVAGARLRRGLAKPESLVLAVSLAVVAYFAVHLNFDWLEEIPALAGPAFALPLVALVAAARAQAARADGPAHAAITPARRAGAIAVAAVAVVALVALVPPWLSVRYTERGEERAASDLEGARSDFDRARSLNPASLEPDLAEGRAAVAARSYPVARQAFERSLDVEDNWLAHFELALFHAADGRFGPAARELGLARELNARDPALARVERLIDARRRVDPQRENLRLQRRIFARFTTSGT